LLTPTMEPSKFTLVFVSIFLRIPAKATPYDLEPPVLPIEIWPDPANTFFRRTPIPSGRDGVGGLKRKTASKWG